MAYYEKSPSNLKHTITIRCTPNQHKIWSENARKSGLSLNAYIRVACTYLATKEDNAGVVRYYNLASKEIEGKDEEKREKWNELIELQKTNKKLLKANKELDKANNKLLKIILTSKK